MPKEKLKFTEKLYHYVKQFVNRITYSQNLFDDNVWQLRFSTTHPSGRRYTTEKKTFTFALRNVDDIFKYILGISLIGMLIGMIFMSRSVGISTREIEQNNYSEMVYNHFTHQGDENAYKEHPYASTQAQYIDVLLYALGKILNIKDIFLLKHLISAIFGWLLIVYLSILILRAFSWRAAFFTAFFLFISPRFFGYSVCNVVDVTFAFGFVFTITQIYYLCSEMPVIHKHRLIQIVLGTLLALSTYNAGLILVHFFTLFILLKYLLSNPIRKFFTLKYLKQLGLICLLIIGYNVLIYAIHSIGTGFLTRSIVPARDAFQLLTLNYPCAQNQLFEGHIIGPNNFPKYYLGRYLFITTPTIILIGFLLFFVFFKTAIKSLHIYTIFIILYPFCYCLFKMKDTYMNPDTMWAIHYLIYPLFVMIAACGIECTLRTINDKYTNFVVMCIIFLLSVMPIRHILFNQPMTSLYFNEISGGIHNAYTKYDLDVPHLANKQACQWMSSYLYQQEIGQHTFDQKYVVATNGNEACPLFFAKDTNIILRSLPYYATDTTWDFYIDFCHDYPAAQLRNGTWPWDTTLRTMRVETKPIVAFYQNAYRARQRFLLDSIANVEQARLDSIAHLMDSLARETP